MQTKADFLDIIYTTRAIRKFTQQSVPNESIRKILEAATQAPSGGNRQPWRFLVIRDQDQKEKSLVPTQNPLVFFLFDLD